MKISSSYHYDSTGVEKSTVKELEEKWDTNSRAGLASKRSLAPEPTLGRSATPTVGQRLQLAKARGAG